MEHIEKTINVYWDKVLGQRLVYAVVDNSIDEAMADIFINLIEINNDSSLLVEDDGRGIPWNGVKVFQLLK